MTVYDRIRLRREEIGLTQDDVAQAMGYKSRTSINKIESGINDIPRSKIVQLANILHTTPAYLMGWEEEEKNSPSADELFPKKQALMQFVQAVPEDKAEMILQVMKTILQVD